MVGRRDLHGVLPRPGVGLAQDALSRAAAWKRDLIVRFSWGPQCFTSCCPWARKFVIRRRILGRMPALWLVVIPGIALGLPIAAVAQPLATTPSFEELEAAQARIGEVRVRTGDVFDTEDPKESGMLFRWANALHYQTRTSVIENALLFKRGDRVSVAVIEETERLLRAERYLYDVQIRPLAYQD